MRRQFPADARPVVAPPWIESRFEDFRKLVHWLKEEQVETRFYLNPLHPHVAEAYGEKRLTEFKQKIKDLSGAGPIKDCTQLFNTRDVNMRFYDYKHFLPDNTKAVIECGISKSAERRKTPSFRSEI